MLPKGAEGIVRIDSLGHQAPHKCTRHKLIYVFTSCATSQLAFLTSLAASTQAVSTVRNAQAGRVKPQHAPSTLWAALRVLSCTPASLQHRRCHRFPSRLCHWSLPHSASPRPPPPAGGSATICRNWFITPNFPGEHGVPIWCPALGALSHR